MHWSKQFAEMTMMRKPHGPIVVASGISLSGPVHVGHSREFLTAALIANEIVRVGRQVRFVAFADDLDPLRKVYPFLPESYSRWVGCPLNRIPDPFGCHSSYSEHFLADLKVALDKIGVKPEIIRSSDLYNSGAFALLIKKTLQERHRVAEIITSVTGRDPKKGVDTWPIRPECPHCFSISRTKVLAWNDNVLEIHCDSCSSQSEVNLNCGGGKLIWRCDWPMRWAHLGVTIEPFGYDHSTAGGSYDSGVRLAREIYNIEPPIPAPYAWLHFKSGGAMHSSSGKAILVADLADAYPSEIFWWMIVRRDPGTVIKFDPQQGLLDEAGSLRRTLRGESTRLDAEALASIQSGIPVNPVLAEYPLNHLILAAQIGGFDPDGVLRVLHRSRNYKDSVIPANQVLLQKIRIWLDRYGAQLRINVPGEHATAPADERTKNYIASLVDELKMVEWNSVMIHNLIHETAKRSGLNSREAFAILYRRFLGSEQGPRMGWMLEGLGRERTLKCLSKNNF